GINRVSLFCCQRDHFADYGNNLSCDTVLYPALVAVGIIVYPFYHSELCIA
ncbi:MAG: hypothetical protein ACI88H_003329, partial [Cocleimonas sp.]